MTFGEFLARSAGADHRLAVGGPDPDLQMRARGAVGEVAPNVQAVVVRHPEAGRCCRKRAPGCWRWDSVRPLWARRRIVALMASRLAGSKTSDSSWRLVPFQIWRFPAATLVTVRPFCVAKLEASGASSAITN